MPYALEGVTVKKDKNTGIHSTKDSLYDLPILNLHFCSRIYIALFPSS